MDTEVKVYIKSKPTKPYFKLLVAKISTEVTYQLELLLDVGGSLHKLTSL